MTVEDIRTHITETSKDTNEEFKRLFHGRGGLYESWKHLTIDSIDSILSVALYFKEAFEDELMEMLVAFTKFSKYKTLVIQRRYTKGTTSEVLVGELTENIYVVENGIKIKLNLLNNRNSGYFPDMKIGREFIQKNAKDKRVLNLFSYTCAFSLAAKLGNAYEVVNVDMSKSALKTGMANHSLNAFNPRGTSFLSYNILKSFSSLKRKGPYDIIIIDPPSFQRGSFEVTKDYEKLIKRLEELASEDCLLLACLNSPELECDFIINMIEEFAPNFKFTQRLENVKEFQSTDEEKSLKNLVFQRQS